MASWVKKIQPQEQKKKVRMAWLNKYYCEHAADVPLLATAPALAPPPALPPAPDVPPGLGCWPPPVPAAGSFPRPPPG